MGPARALIVSALLVRILALPLSGTEDVLVWKTWSYGAAAQGVTTLYGVGGSPPVRGAITWGHWHTSVDYPPLALYEIAPAGVLYSHAVPQFSDSRGLTAIVKLPALLADAALALLLWLFVVRRSPADGRRIVAAYWLNPAIVLAGAVLGYLDPLMALPAVAAILAAPSRPALAGALLAAAILTKLQAAFIAPVVMLALWNTARHKVAAFGAAFAGAAVTSGVILAPFVARGAWRNMLLNVSSLFRHDMLSGNAANVWWLVTYVIRAAYAARDLGAWAAWTMPTRILAISRVMELGYPNPRIIGTAAFAVAAIWILWRARRVAAAPLLLATAAIVVHAYFTLAAQVHENHLFLALPLLAGASALRPRLRPVLVALSAVFALNLFLFYGIGRDWPLPPRGITLIDATVLLAAANVALFFWHARRFAVECASEEGTDEPAVHLDGGAGYVGRTR